MGHLYHGYVSHNQMVWGLNMAKVGLGLAKKPADAGDVGELPLVSPPKLTILVKVPWGRKYDLHIFWLSNMASWTIPLFFLDDVHIKTQ